METLETHKFNGKRHGDELELAMSTELGGYGGKKAFSVHYLSFVPGSDGEDDSFNVCESETFFNEDLARFAFAVRKNSNNPYDTSGVPSDAARFGDGTVRAITAMSDARDCLPHMEAVPVDWFQPDTGRTVIVVSTSRSHPVGRPKAVLAYYRDGEWHRADGPHSLYSSDLENARWMELPAPLGHIG